MVLVKKATGLDGVSACLLKYAGMSPSLTIVFDHSVKACKSSDQWKLLASVRRSKKDERKTEHVTDHYLCSA